MSCISVDSEEQGPVGQCFSVLVFRDPSVVSFNYFLAPAPYSGHIGDTLIQLVPLTSSTLNHVFRSKETSKTCWLRESVRTSFDRHCSESP